MLAFILRGGSDRPIFLGFGVRHEYGLSRVSSAPNVQPGPPKKGQAPTWVGHAGEEDGFPLTTGGNDGEGKEISRTRLGFA